MIRCHNGKDGFSKNLATPLKTGHHLVGKVRELNLIFISSEDAPTPGKHRRRRTLNQVHLLEGLVLVKMPLHYQDPIHSRMKLGRFPQLRRSFLFSFLRLLLLLLVHNPW